MPPLTPDIYQIQNEKSICIFSWLPNERKSFQFMHNEDTDDDDAVVVDADPDYYSTAAYWPIKGDFNQWKFNFILKFRIQIGFNKMKMNN